MKRNHKKLYISLLVFLTLIMISWFVLFEYSFRWLEKRLEIVAADLTQKGYIFAYSKFDMTGNPLAVKAIFHNPHIKDPRGFFEWQGQEVIVTMRPWWLYSLDCTFLGDQKVSFPQNKILGVLQLEGAKGSINLTSQGVLEEITFSADHLSSFIGHQLQPISLQDVSFKIKNLIDPLNATISLTTQLLSREEFLSADSHNQPLTVILEGMLAGFQPNQSSPTSLAEWRDGGGVLEVKFFNLVWHPIRLEAEGTLTLDKNMYPLGSFSSKITGYNEALNETVKLGWVKQKNAAAVSFMLDLFSKSDEEGGKQLIIPITLQNKTLSVGPVRLFKLSPIE